MPTAFLVKLNPPPHKGYPGYDTILFQARGSEKSGTIPLLTLLPDPLSPGVVVSIRVQIHLRKIMFKMVELH